MNLIADAVRGAGVDECAAHSCVSSSCLNGATCSSDNDVGYRCSCPDGFSGTRCEYKITPCAQAGTPCLNNGECLAVTGGHRCVCTFDSSLDQAFVGSTCNQCK